MKTYIIKQGDTLWSIAKNNGISLNDLLASNNHITNPNLVLPNQVINIPSTNQTNQNNYTVLQNDTLLGITNKLGINLNNLISNNPQIKLLPGQVLIIPRENQPTTPTTPGTPSPTTPTTPDNNQADTKSLESEVVRLVNVERQKAGLSPLTDSSEISRLARLKSQDFIDKNYFSHNSPTYGTPFDMLKSNNISYSSAGENIASGQRTASEVMNSWMNSSGHRQNILNSNYNKIGVGAATDSSGKTYWTQIFTRS